MSPQHGRPDHEIEDHDRGLEFDLQTLSRRRALAMSGSVSSGYTASLKVAV